MALADKFQRNEEAAAAVAPRIIPFKRAPQNAQEHAQTKRARTGATSLIYKALIVFLGGVVVAAAAAGCWLWGAYYTLLFAGNVAKMFGVTDFGGPWVWAIPGALSALEFAGMYFVKQDKDIARHAELDIEFGAFWLAFLSIDAITTAAGAIVWLNNSNLWGGILIYIALGMVVGFGLALVPEVLFRKGMMLIGVAGKMLLAIGG